MFRQEISFGELPQREHLPYWPIFTRPLLSNETGGSPPVARELRGHSGDGCKDAGVVGHTTL